MIVIGGLCAKINLGMQAENYIIGLQIKKANKIFIIGDILTLISGIVAYRISTGKLDIQSIISENKNKVKIKISKKLKQILEEDNN